MGIGILECMHMNHHYFHLPHHHVRPITLLHVSSTLRTFVFSFFGLLLPIVLVKAFGDWGMDGAILVVVGLYILGQAVRLVLFPVVTAWVGRWGLKFGLLLSQLLMMVFFYLMLSSSWVLAFMVFGLANGFWWYCYHLYFVELSTGKHVGAQVGMASALGVLTGVVAPLLGGWLLVTWGNLGFYLGAGLLIVLSIISILLFDISIPVKEVSWARIDWWLRTKRRDALAYIGAAGEAAIYGLAWPLFLYFLFEDVLLLAAFSSGIVLVTGVLNFITGKYIDSKDKVRMEHVGSIAVASTWVGKVIALPDPIGLSLFDLVHKLLVGVRDLPLQVIAYERAKEDKEGYLAFRETCYRVGMIGGYLGFGILISLGLPLWSVFILAAVMAVGSSIIRN